MITVMLWTFFICLIVKGSVSVRDATVVSAMDCHLQELVREFQLHLKLQSLSRMTKERISLLTGRSWLESHHARPVKL